MFQIAVTLILGLFTTSPMAALERSVENDKLPGITAAPTGGDFSLHSSQGPFSLTALRGKVVLLYFGYTKCPDVCPTSLAFITQALNELNSDELNNVQAVFISVDPKRDTLEGLDEYLDYFHPNLIGVTGSDEEVAKAARLYGAQYYEVELKDSAFGYAVNHSSVTYLISQEGELRFLFPHATDPSVIHEATRYLLDGN